MSACANDAKQNGDGNDISSPAQRSGASVTVCQCKTLMPVGVMDKQNCEARRGARRLR
jgi:hypothetical protein